MFKTNTKFKKGFTIIEIIVVIAITGLLMALAIPAENSYRKKSEIQKSTKELRSLFWEAQARSLAPRTKDITSYKITINSGQAGNSAPIISLKECTVSDCNIIPGGQEAQVVLGKNIKIESIKLGTQIVSGTVETKFAVGNNKDSGIIRFYSPAGTENNANQMEIKIGSIIDETLKYVILVNRQTNSVTYKVE